MRASVHCEPVARVAAITHDEWLAHRRTGIGGSDAAAVVGLSQYSSPYSLWCDKMGLLPPKDDTEAMRQGRDLEQYVADRWMEATGKRCRVDGTMWRSKRWPWMIADIDRKVCWENAGLECKTTSVYNRADFEGGEIPLTYYTQCQHYMAVLGFERMYLAVLVLNRGFYAFEIERDDAEIEALVRAEEAFWRLVESGEAPELDGSTATLNALRTVHPEEADGSFAPLSRQMDAELKRLTDEQDMIRELQADCDAIKARVMDYMGDAAVAENDRYICTWKTRSRVSVDAKTLKREYPDVYAKVIKTTSFRQFSSKAK